MLKEKNKKVESGFIDKKKKKENFEYFKFYLNTKNKRILIFDL